MEAFHRISHPADRDEYGEAGEGDAVPLIQFLQRSHPVDGVVHFAVCIL